MQRTSFLAQNMDLDWDLLKQRGWKTLCLGPNPLTELQLPPHTPPVPLDPAGNWDQLADTHQVLMSCSWAGSPGPRHWSLQGQKPVNASAPQPTPPAHSGWHWATAGRGKGDPGATAVLLSS